MEEPVDDLFDLDLEPTSEIRPIDSRARRLVVDSGLRGPAAEAAWIIIMSLEGVVFFEGAPSADGCVEMSLEASPLTKVRVRLETARCHRQAEVVLTDGWTAHAFSP
jgi:hypothetical protein